MITPQPWFDEVEQLKFPTIKYIHGPKTRKSHYYHYQLLQSRFRTYKVLLIMVRNVSHYFLFIPYWLKNTLIFQFLLNDYQRISKGGTSFSYFWTLVACLVIPDISRCFQFISSDYRDTPSQMVHVI